MVKILYVFGWTLHGYISGSGRLSGTKWLRLENRCERGRADAAQNRTGPEEW